MSPMALRRSGAWITIALLAAVPWTIAPVAADDVCVEQPVGPFNVSGCVPVDECAATEDDPEAEVCVRPDQCLRQDMGFTSVRVCPLPRDQRDQDGDGFTPAAGDCDDNDSFSYPGASEQPDGKDNDCDGVVDNGVDADGDGFTVEDGDCDDFDPSTYPGASEQPDGIDNDCDGVVDNGWDADGDGFTTQDGDCDDNDPNTYPNAPEILDGKDNDCDGIVDEGT